MKRRVLSATILGLASALLVSTLNAGAAGKPQITDPLGDANFINDQGTGDGSFGDFNQADAGTVSDITAILDQQKPDPARAEQLRASADAPVPDNLKGLQLADFYYKRAQARARFTSEAPLFKHRLVSLNGEESASQSLLSRPLKLDERIVRFLLGIDVLDEAIAPFSSVITPSANLEEVLLPAPEKVSLVNLFESALRDGTRAGSDGVKAGANEQDLSN